MRPLHLLLQAGLLAAALAAGRQPGGESQTCEDPLPATTADSSLLLKRPSREQRGHYWARISLLQRRAEFQKQWVAAELQDDDLIKGGPGGASAESNHGGGGPGHTSHGSSHHQASGPGRRHPSKGTGSRGIDRSHDKLALAHALAVDSGLVIAYAAVFCFLRYQFPVIYMHNVLAKKVQSLREKGCCGSVSAYFCKATDEVEKILGLDGAMFLEFPVFCMRLLLTIGVPLVFVLWPLSCGSLPDEGGICADAFVRPELDLGSRIYWVQAAAVWLVVVGVEVNILLAQRSFAKRRREWLRRLPPPWSTTILVENIPQQCRSDSRLRRCFEDRFPPDAVESVYLVKRTGALPLLVGAAESARRRLACANAQWKRTGWMPDRRPTHLGSSGQQVDSIFGYGEEAKRCEQVAQESLERFRRASQSGEGDLVSGSGFVTFRRRHDAALALAMHLKLQGQRLEISIPPDPADVVYADLMLESRERMATEVVGYVCVGLVFFLFTPITLAIISITRLTTLRQFVPLFDTIVTTYPEIHRFWDGMMGSFVLNLVMGFVPTIFSLIFRYCFALKSELWRQQRVQRWYLYFLIVFVLLVTAIGESLALVYVELAQNPARTFDLLAASLPGASQFYLKFFMFQWACEALQLTRHSILGKFLVYRIWHDQERSRELAEPEDQDYDGIGARSARLTLMLVIALVFSTVSPLVCPLAFLHFCLCRASYSYLLIFAEEWKRDLGGVFWCTQMKHVQQGMFFYVCLMVGILYERADNYWPGVAAAGSFAVLVPCYLYFRQLALETLPLQEAAACDEAHGQQAKCGCYEQPELNWT